MGMRLYLDLDCLVKLCALGLLDDTLSLFGIQPKDVFVDAAFQYSCAKEAKRLETKRDIRAKAFRTAIDRLKSFSEVNSCIGADLASRIQGINGIDPGELSLLSALFMDSGAICLATGDKRFLKALAEFASDDYFAPVHGKMIHLEQILRVFCDRPDFAEKFLPRMLTPEAQQCDKSIPVFFHCGGKMSGQIEALESFISDYASVFCATNEQIREMFAQK